MPHSKSEREPVKGYNCALCFGPMAITHKVEWMMGKRYRRWECPRCAHSSSIRLPEGSYYYEPW